jgi:hypothetical protein
MGRPRGRRNKTEAELAEIRTAVLRTLADRGPISQGALFWECRHVATAYFIADALRALVAARKVRVRIASFPSNGCPARYYSLTRRV